MHSESLCESFRSNADILWLSVNAITSGTSILVYHVSFLKGFTLWETTIFHNEIRCFVGLIINYELEFCVGLDRFYTVFYDLLKGFFVSLIR